MSKKTVIIGASTNPSRYAYLAATRLVANNHEVVPLGIKSGRVANHEIIDLRSKPELSDVDTVTMYLNPTNQLEWEDYILSLEPKRIIFNPGTENPTFEKKANQMRIESIHACTLVMLSTGEF